MYRNLINKIVEEKVQQNNQITKQQASYRRIENAKYNSSDLLIGYVSKIINDSNNRLSKLISNTPKIFVRVKGAMLQDIETGKEYPLILTEESPKQDVLCVLENDIEPFVSVCLQTFAEKGIEYDVTLSKNQARDILYRQAKLDSLGF